MALRAGLIGFGLAGRHFHAPLLAAAGFDLRCVMTSRRSEVTETLPQAIAVATVGDIIRRNDIDLIVVASPTALHFEHAKAALQANKHVVVDKPVALAAAEAHLLSEAARAHGRVLAVFQNRRWDSDFLTLQKLIAEGRLGQITAFRARWDRFRPQVQDRWRERAEPGGGMLYDLGAHLIDQALVLFGKPDWLQADVFTQREGCGADDAFEILMGKGTLRICLGVSLLAGAGDFRYCVHGTAGSFLKSGLDPQEDQLRAGASPLDSEFGIEAADQWGTWVATDGAKRDTIRAERGRWLTFYESVKRSIMTGTEAPVDARAGALVLEMIEAARLSSTTGRRIQF